ncbi:hypothetical protein [Ramlibacter sp.]|uniref:hypothetical protein n=1 Tax=Ramlibacter sp. TaxID=1917967 RepID=UPI003D0F3647
MGRLAMSVLWPAFLCACALEFVVFAQVDPAELNWGLPALHLSRQAVYTVAFFVFWAISAVGCALSASLQARGE